jgi:hypothetical protein
MLIIADRAVRAKIGEKVDLTRQKGFLVFPNRFESVKVG